MIPGLHEAVQRMDHAAFVHIYIIWASENHQAPIPTKENESEIREDWVQIMDIIGINPPEAFLKKLIPHWAWVLKTLTLNQKEHNAANIRDLLSGKIGQASGPERNQTGTLLRISPVYKKLTHLMGKISEESLTGSLKKYLNKKKDTQLFLISYLSREALFNAPKLPVMTTLSELNLTVRTQIEKEFGPIKEDFCDSLTRLWLYGLYFSGAPLTPEKLISFLEHMITIPDLAIKTSRFSGKAEEKS